MYIIHNKNGGNITTTHRLTYDATHMGDAYVYFDISAPQPINWQIGDYIEFRGQRFVMTVLPTATRAARDNSRGDAVQYKNVRFQSEIIAMMQDTMMLDYVTDDNKLHYTSLPNFSFYCSDDTVTFDEQGQAVARCAGAVQLADRLMANLQRAYPTKLWRVVIEDGITIKPQSISVSNQSTWNVLADACQKLGINFTAASLANDDSGDHDADDPIDYTVAHTITLGAIVHEIDNEFRYGKEFGISQGAGLKSIEQASDENQQVITRLYAYGSTRNMPYRYYNNLPNVSESMYLPNLMLPMFRENGKVAYIDSPRISTLGIKEGVKFFDGSDSETEEIYPSLKGMTTQTLYDAMTTEQRTEQNMRDPQQYTAWNQGAVDEIISAEQVTFDGIIPEQQQTAPTFKVVIKNIGFDPNEQIITGETPRMVFNSGMLAGRECNIRTVEKIVPTNGPTTYRVTLEVAQDTSINQYFPNVNYQISAGDKFVLAGIRMHDVYVANAEQRLLAAAQAFLDENDHTRYNYKLEIDNIYMMRHADIAEQIMAGTKLHIFDNSLGIDEHTTISQLKITVGNAQIPEYEITLSESIEPSLLQRTTTQATEQAVQTMDAISTANTNRIIERINALSESFITKRGYDRAVGKVVFARGIMAGEDTTAMVSSATLTQDELVIKDYESEVRQVDTATYDNINEVGMPASENYSRYAETTIELTLTEQAVISIELALQADNATFTKATVTAFDTNKPQTPVLDYQLVPMNQETTVQFLAEQGTHTYKVRCAATATTEQDAAWSIEFSGATMATSTQAQPRAMKMTPSGIYRLTDQGTWAKLL